MLLPCYLISTKCERLKIQPNITRIVIHLECLLISVDLLGMGGSCVPLRADVGDWCDVGENGIMSKMSVEGDITDPPSACNEERN